MRECSPSAESIGLASKHGAKRDDHVQELPYLRHHNPVKLNALLKEIRNTRPALWLSLQAHPAVTSLGHEFSLSQAGGHYLEAGVTAVIKGPVAAAVQFGENTVTSNR